ncbi:MAG TPA: Clp protease ClpP [Mycolicibacterium fallax]|nr:Clp protease ClpP [Mycolicibacterium fallax]
MVTARPTWYQIRNAAPDATGPAEVLIYDEIDSWFGVSAEQLARDIAALDDSRDLLVRINSPGGNVYDGVAILNSLRGHPGKVTVVVDGLAASAASVIAMGGDEIVMNRNSELMIHNGRAAVVGGAEDMRKMADRLEAVNANLAAIYTARAGGTVEDWRAVMAAETWYSADEAVEAGLADRVETGSADARAIAAKFDLSVFAHAGRAHAPAPPAIQTPSAEAEVVSQHTEGDRHMPTLQEGLAQLLGIPADADEGTILAAAAEALDERSEDTPVEPVEPSVDQLTEVAARHNLTVIDADQHAALLAAAQAGAQARAQQIREADERLVDAAIADGKFPVARRDHHLTALAADREGHTAVINALAPGLVPLTEKGHGVTADITNEDDAIYASLFGKDA